MLSRCGASGPRQDLEVTVRLSVTWKAHCTGSACLRRRWLHPMDVRRFPRTPALGGVRLWVPWLFLLPGACLATHHREGGLCLKNKREEEHAIKADRNVTAHNCHFTSSLEQRCVVVVNSSSYPAGLGQWVGMWLHFPFRGCKALGCAAGRRCNC